jgi:hypothetical protein
MKISWKTLILPVVLAFVISAQQEEKESDAEEKAAVEEAGKAKEEAADAQQDDKDTARADAEEAVADSAAASQKDTAAAQAEAAGTTGGLKIVTTPDDAVVVIDDVMKGRTPLEVKELEAGEHILLLKKKGFFVKKATVSVSVGTTSELSFELAQPIDLAITSEPKGANASVDGEQVGVTPCVAGKLKPGEHEVSLTLKGYEPFIKTVKLEIAKSDTLHAKLTRT